MWTRWRGSTVKGYKVRKVFTEIKLRIVEVQPQSTPFLLEDQKTSSDSYTNFWKKNYDPSKPKLRVLEYTPGNLQWIRLGVKGVVTLLLLLSWVECTNNISSTKIQYESVKKFKLIHKWSYKWYSCQKKRDDRYCFKEKLHLHRFILT